jgi:hypothetical protein
VHVLFCARCAVCRKQFDRHWVVSRDMSDKQIQCIRIFRCRYMCELPVEILIQFKALSVFERDTLPSDELLCAHEAITSEQYTSEYSQTDNYDEWIRELRTRCQQLTEDREVFTRLATYAEQEMADNIVILARALTAVWEHMSNSSSDNSYDEKQIEYMQDVQREDSSKLCEWVRRRNDVVREALAQDVIMTGQLIPEALEIHELVTKVLDHLTHTAQV